MDFKQIMDIVSRGFEVVGIAVLVIGFLTGLFLALRDFMRGERSGVYRMIRTYFGRSMLLGLEVLVAADLIRTFLSFSLEIEIDGMVPWRRWRQMAPGPPPPERRNDIS